MFEELDNNSDVVPEIKKTSSVEEILDNVVGQYDVESYKFDTDMGQVVILSNLHEALGETVKAEFACAPSAFVSKLTKYLDTSEKVDDSFILTKLLSAKGINLPKDDRLMPMKDVENLDMFLRADFIRKNPDLSKASQQAMFDGIRATNLVSDKELATLFKLETFEYSVLLDRMPNFFKQKVSENLKMINARYSDYRKPLTTPEATKITVQLIDLIRKYNPDKSILIGAKSMEGIDSMIYSIKLFLNNKAHKNDNLRRYLQEYVKEYGGSLRFLLDKNVPEQLKMAKMEQFMVNLTIDRPEVISAYASMDKEGLEYIRYKNPETYKTLKQFLEM
jgi:hypothetical protein